MSTSRPLTGFRVLDFTHAAAGPYATMWLADLGAEIIKIEKPGRGDGARYMGEPMHGPKHSDYFVALNPDKQSVSVDLHTPDGVALVKEIAAHCDLVIQNFRPGVLEKLGLGFDDLRAVRTGLVYCSLSAFGAESTWRNRPANDIIMQGVTGMMDITGEPEGDPVRVGVPISDFATGLFGLSGALAALLARDAHPEGQHVEVTMFDATLALMANYIPGVLDLGREVPRLGRGHPQIVPYQAFRCSDDGYVIIGAFTSAFWRRLAVALGHEEWITDDRFATNAARVDNRDILVPLIEEILTRRPRDEWCRVLEDADVPHTPVNSAREALLSRQAVESQTTIEVHDEMHTRTGHVAANPIRSAAWPTKQHRTSPHIGEHSTAVLSGLLGKSTDDIDELVNAGIVGREETK